MKQYFINFRNWLKEFFLDIKIEQSLSEVEKLTIRLKELFELNNLA